MQNYLWTKDQGELRRYITCIKTTVSVTHVYCSHIQFCKVDRKLMKGKVLRKHSLHEKIAASVLLKLFISSNE